MAPAFLTVDLGNSACKLLAWERLADGAVRPSLRLVLAADDDLPRAAAAGLGGCADWVGGAMASVVEPDSTARISDALAELVGGRFLAPPDPGLDVACDHPETVGLDRLFAARGALEVCGAPAVVVDAGTALTVDALCDDGSGGGVFAGGAIAPGPALWATALAAKGALLPQVEPRPGAPALGLDTERALVAGCSVGFLGAARELVERVSAEAGVGAAPLVLAGGARAFLGGPDGLGRGGRRVVECADLVHRGLLATGGPQATGAAWEPA
ncbi:MAG: type III pantothenate kinase [Planctomycetota bacterium]|nr:type III pantothenate kinase [Planctomycetota bacterium]MDP6761553.1 type III pantothenate kinase [Planctomycetota bacterium]MDP6990645.1 type III pantothenate kinase [Planctomycetota bacterium]